VAEQIERRKEFRSADVDDLAKSAAYLFEQQPELEKRKLMRFVLTDCPWKARRLSYQYKEPFTSQETTEARAA
jgi:hypothetical protein